MMDLDKEKVAVIANYDNLMEAEMAKNRLQGSHRMFHLGCEYSTAWYILPGVFVNPARLNRGLNRLVLSWESIPRFPMKIEILQLTEGASFRQAG
ncbi:MAG: hypothetical protein U0T82_13995 [Bacteroidales bacterium]